MRRLAIALLFTLATACGQGAGGNTSAGGLGSAFSDGFRKSYRAKFIDTCSTSAKKAAVASGNPAGAGLDCLPLCGCAADRLLATKSLTELMSGPSAADQQAVTQQCLREHPPT